MPALTLRQALSVRPGVTAIIGGGGKSTLLLQLGLELARSARVILCTTTHIYPPEGVACLQNPSEAELSAALRAEGCVCVGTPCENGKLRAPELPVGRLAALADYVLAEADGAKGRPLKAHAAHEPVIPPQADQTILVLGLSGLGRPISEAAHRPELYSARLGVTEDALVTPELAAELLCLEALHTRVLLNQADTAARRQAARALAARLSCPVCMAALQKGWIECLS